VAQQRVLVVDDEGDIRNVVALYLRREGFDVESVADGEAALEAIERYPPNLIILDIMMPKLSGLEVIHRLRPHRNIPVIMLTSRDEEVDKIVGLEVGADDYVTKPFSPRELAARVKAVLRRAGEKPVRRDPDRAPVTVGDIAINPQTRQVEVKGNPVTLTAKGFDLLWLLATHKGQVFSREELLEKVWGYDFYGDTNTVTVLIRRLRQQIEPDPANPRYILTVWGIGYKFEED
jgi:DNA-binding response OmpR family regulator